MTDLNFLPFLLRAALFGAAVVLVFWALLCLIDVLRAMGRPQDKPNARTK